MLNIGGLYAYCSMDAYEMERDLLEEFTLVLNVPLFYKYDTKETKLAGTAAIFIDLWEIEEILYKSNIIERQVFLIDQNNKVFDVYNKTYLPENKNETMKILNFNSKDKMQVVKNIKGLNWQVVSIFSKNYIDDKTTLFKKDCMYCIFIIVLLSIAYSFFISYRILKPINQINYYINTVELDSAGDININEFYIDEIDNIGKNFVMMTERIEKLVDELMVSQYNNLILDKKGKKAQIKALQAEITPHFLYNTLDIIINLIHSMKTEKAISMIQALSDLFRYSITDNEMSSISIGEELRYAESYANILAVHYNEHVHFKWEIEPDIEAYECTRMFLQPLIENCVIHALGKDDLVVIIRCKRDGNGILFEVEDNGTGISETDLNNIRNAIKEENGYDLHVGLSNIYSRLKLLYGDSFSFDIQSSLGIGTIVAIKIPAKKISK